MKVPPEPLPSLVFRASIKPGLCMPLGFQSRGPHRNPHGNNLPHPGRADAELQEEERAHKGFTTVISIVPDYIPPTSGILAVNMHKVTLAGVIRS